MIKKRGVLKFVVWIVIIALAIPILGYFYVKNTWDDFITENELIEFVTKIKIADELPDRFYELYEQEHPHVLSYDLNRQLIGGLVTNDFTKSPSVLAAMISEHSRQGADSTKISNRKVYALAWKLEEETSQRECLNWVLANYKFDLYIHGINEVANFYYKKNVSQLNDRELSDIIALMKEPSIVSVPDRTDEHYEMR